MASIPCYPRTTESGFASSQVRTTVRPEKVGVMSDDTSHFARLDGPHLRGQATEAIVTAEFLKRGIPVLVPAYDNEPYDLVIDYGGGFHRLQVKTGYDHNGTIRSRQSVRGLGPTVTNGVTTANAWTTSRSTARRRKRRISWTRRRRGWKDAAQIRAPGEQSEAGNQLARGVRTGRGTRAGGMKRSAIARTRTWDHLVSAANSSELLPVTARRSTS